MDKLVPICVRVPKELYNKLKVYCAEKEKKMKNVVAELLRGLK